jgi:hypothetical protein
MKNQEQTYETQLNDLTPLLDANDVWHYSGSVIPPMLLIYTGFQKSLQAVLSFYTSAIEDLFHRRVHKIDEASAMREQPLVRSAVA